MNTTRLIGAIFIMATADFAIDCVNNSSDAATNTNAQMYTIDQSVSDRAQLGTISFDGLAFITGNFGALRCLTWVAGVLACRRSDRSSPLGCGLIGSPEPLLWQPG